MGLHWRRGEPDFRTGKPTVEVFADRDCQNCDRPVTLAHASYEVVAMTLAEPLRRAFWKHVDEHGEACVNPMWGGWLCPEAARLRALLPAGDGPVPMAQVSSHR